MKYLRRYQFLILVTLVLSVFFVALNSLALWMVASLINNVLVSPESIPVGPAESGISTNLYGQLRAWTADLIQQSTPLKTLARLAMILMTVFVLKNIVLYLKTMSAGVVENRLIRDLRNDLFSHLQSLSLAYYAQQKSAEISSIVINDVGAVRRAFTISIQKLIVEPINLATMITILFIISRDLSFLVMPLIPIAGIVTTRLGRSLRRRARRTTEQIAGVMEVLQANIRGMRIVQAFTMEDHEIERFKQTNHKYYQVIFRGFSLRHVITPTNEIIGVFFGIVILWVGGQQVLLGKGLGAEEFMSYLIFMFAMLQPIRSLSGISADVQTGLASAERIFALLDEPITIVDDESAVTVTEFRDKIIFRNVFYNYESSAQPALSEINLEIRQGSITALVGVSGAGKSTLADLLARFYDVSAGSITLDGTDIRDIRLKSLRSLFGFVTQETYLFNTSIRENIMYGNISASEEQLMAAARAAHAWEFIQDLPNGFETEIGEDGVTLSGGQRQRLAIARALLKNPPLLILDEATSSLDSESERHVQEAIANLIHDRTVVVIAHRFSTIKGADSIVVLDKGRIVEMGGHEELISRGGKYYQLYEQQFASI